MTIFGDFGDLISRILTPGKAAPMAPEWNMATTTVRPEGVRHAVPRDRRKRKAPPGEPDTSKRTKRRANSQSPEAEKSSLRKNRLPSLKPDRQTLDHKRAEGSKKVADRALMPPPLLPMAESKMHTSVQQHRPVSPQFAEEESDEADELASDDRDGPPRPQLTYDHKDIQQRYEDATALPQNSGIWSEVEKDLFYRLALRGVEPLLPNNWMKDFPTFPLSCFAYKSGSTPLITPQKEGDFRAIRALRELVDMGQRVRDRALATRQLQPEPVILKSVHRYISWALTDVGLHHDQFANPIPIHAIEAMQPGQATQDVITGITSKLHKLGARHREAQNIRTSVESRERTPLSNGETRIVDDDGELPILTGLMICASLVIIVTLSCHDTPPETSDTPALTQQPTPTRTSSLEARENSGLRFIATFDFSEGGQDVWNALAIAITAIYVRKSAVIMQERAIAAGDLKSWKPRKSSGKQAMKPTVDDPDL